MSSTVDFNLHGLVGIRLVDATTADAAAVERQVGPIRAPLAREPDIVIRWVDRLHTTSPLRILGDHEAAFSDDAFVILRGKNKSRLRVQIPFETIGRRCEIVCERSIPAVPLLVPIIHLTMLAKGVVPIHASAFIYHGRGVLAAGWSKGGKTETLLSFLAHGAQYISDDWAYISADGRQLYGIPEPIQLRGWHLDDLPHVRRRVRLCDRATLWPFALAERWQNAASRNHLLPRSLSRLLHFMGRQGFTKADPRRLFGSQFAVQPAPFDQLLLLASHDSPEIAVETIGPLEVARRMVFSVQHERRGLLEYYYRFRFAFPDRPNALLDQSERLQLELLTRVLAGKPALAVWHPYPVRLPALYDTIHRHLDPAANPIAQTFSKCASLADTTDTLVTAPVQES